MADDELFPEPPNYAGRMTQWERLAQNSQDPWSPPPHTHPCPGCYEHWRCTQKCDLEPDMEQEDGSPCGSHVYCSRCQDYITRYGEDALFGREKIDIDLYFGLSYSNYLVVPRALLASAPKSWQHRFTELLLQLYRAAEDHKIETATEYHVQAVTVSDDVDEEGDRIETPVEDPIPHYRHSPNLFGR